jgi:hypothetical protein
MATGKAPLFDSDSKLRADVNGDSAVDAVDASQVLSYYAYTATSYGDKLISPENFFKRNIQT